MTIEMIKKMATESSHVEVIKDIERYLQTDPNCSLLWAVRETLKLYRIASEDANKINFLEKVEFALMFVGELAVHY